MLAELAAGQTDAKRLVDLACGRMRSRMLALEKVLTGLVQPHHHFLLTRQGTHIGFLGERIEELNAKIARQVEMMSGWSTPTNLNVGAGVSEGSLGTE